MNRYLSVASIFIITFFTSNALSCELSDISEVKTLNQLVDCDYALVSTDATWDDGEYFIVYHFQRDTYADIPGLMDMDMNLDSLNNLQNVISCVMIMDDLSIEMCISPGETLS